MEDIFYFKKMNDKNPPIDINTLNAIKNPFRRKKVLKKYHKWLFEQRQIDKKVKKTIDNSIWRRNNVERVKEHRRRYNEKLKILNSKSKEE